MARMAVFFRNAWNKEPVVTVSVGIGVVGEAAAFSFSCTDYNRQIYRSLYTSKDLPVGVSRWIVQPAHPLTLHPTT
uniref:Complex I-B9 n=1 Tax=Eptatretus burgeri TaxID=7764 RepID=A0A8C4WPG7_EPTBU